MRRANDRGPARWPTTLSRWRAAGALLVVASAMLMRSTSAATAAHALLLEIDGAIGPAIADYVGREFRWLNPGDPCTPLMGYPKPIPPSFRPRPPRPRWRCSIATAGCAGRPTAGLVLDAYKCVRTESLTRNDERE